MTNRLIQAIKDLSPPLIILIVMLILVGGSLYACYNLKQDEAKEALSKAGYADISLMGWAGPLACGQDDSAQYNFQATNPRGETITLTVCCGFFKRCTIRY